MNRIVLIGNGLPSKDDRLIGIEACYKRTMQFAPKLRANYHSHFTSITLWYSFQ